MIYEDEFQRELEAPMLAVFEELKTKRKINPNVLTLLRDRYKNSIRKQHKHKERYPLVEYHIIDGKLYFDEADRVFYAKTQDGRFLHNYKLIEGAIQWAQRRNLPVPNTTLYIWISDRHPWYIDDLESSWPIFVYARPKNVPLPMWPETTFICFWLDKKYSNKCLDWDKSKKLILRRIPKKKEDVVFFKGADTTKTTLQNLRKRLQLFSKSNPFLRIDLSSTYEPLYLWSRYEYLLNLPGHYPWSNRLKYLFLMNSHVINVNARLINLFPQYEDPPYITLIDHVMGSDTYNEILYTYYRCNLEAPAEIKKEVSRLNDTEFENFTEKLENLYEDIKDDKNGHYELIRKRGFEKIQKLNMERIYQYIYRSIIETQAICKNPKCKTQSLPELL